MKSAAKLDPNSKTRTIAAGEFKAKCLQLMDEVNEQRVRLIITKRGKPVAEICPPPAAEKPFRSVIGRTPNVNILGDIISPLPEEWTLPEWSWTGKPNRKGKKR